MTALYGINPYSRQGSFSPALTIAVAVGLAALILFAGTAAANALKEKGGELVVTQVFQHEPARQFAGEENKLLRRKTIGLLQQYAFAFIDAAIQFDTVPRMDSKVFLSIATAMPEDVTAEKIVFDDGSIVLSCAAQHQDSPALFYERLCAKTQFETVTTSTPTLYGGVWRFAVLCTPLVAQGQLAMALPAPSGSAG